MELEEREGVDPVIERRCAECGVELTQREIEAAADPAAQRAKRVEEFREKFANPYVAASRGFIDEVIRPRQTRARLIAALARLETKRDKNPPKKHGNIPL